MAKSTSPKWAVIASWQRYSLHTLKGDAEKALTEWKERQEALGDSVGGSKGGGYFASPPDSALATKSARVVKLADHPVCYIGVYQHNIDRLRSMEEAGNPAFEQYSARAKAISEGWTLVEAV